MLRRRRVRRPFAGGSGPDSGGLGGSTDASDYGAGSSGLQRSGVEAYDFDPRILPVVHTAGRRNRDFNEVLTGIQVSAFHYYHDLVLLAEDGELYAGIDDISNYFYELPVEVGRWHHYDTLE